MIKHSEKFKNKLKEMNIEYVIRNWNRIILYLKDVEDIENIERRYFNENLEYEIKKLKVNENRIECLEKIRMT